VQFQYFDLLKLVSEVIDGLKLNSQAHFQFVTKVDGPQMIYADRGLMLIVLENLLQNAVKYSSKEAFPIIEFGTCHKEGDPDDCFYIKDNGIGFDMEHSAKLFAAFQRLHSERDFPGTGIGLATVKRIIARHGGKIWAEGVPGQGATFYFQLPDLTPTIQGGLRDVGKDSSPS
jgi:signal transduction histidine kinase